MAGFWHEIAEGVFSHAFEPFGVNSYAIAGKAGVVVIDSGNNVAQGTQLYNESVALSAHRAPGGVTALINTHAHYDHCFGNLALARNGVPILGHAGFSQHLGQHAVRALTEYHAGQCEPGISPGLWDDVGVAINDISVSHSLSTDLLSEFAHFNRTLELHAFSPAHTTADLAIRIPDIDLWITGDLVEESGAPSIETDSDLEGWIGALDQMLALATNETLFCPGHGKPADRDYVATQREHLAAIARE